MFSSGSLSRVRACLGVAVVSAVALLAAVVALPASASTGSQPVSPYSACFESLGNASPQFSDVPPDSWFANDVACLAALGVTTGTSSSTFSPGDNVTRAQMALFLSRLAAVSHYGTSSPAVPPTSMPAATPTSVPAYVLVFEDLADVSDEVRAAVAVIFNMGVTTGTSSSTFSPGDYVTRAQMAMFLARFVEAVSGPPEPAAFDSLPFEDLADVSDEVRAAVAVIFNMGVTTGTSPSTFSPGDYVTRAQMASFLARVYRAVHGAGVADAPSAPTGLSASASRSDDFADGFVTDVSWDAAEVAKTDYVRYDVQVYDPADPNLLWPPAGLCSLGYVQPPPTGLASGIPASVTVNSPPISALDVAADFDAAVGVFEVRVRTVEGPFADGPALCSGWATAPVDAASVSVPARVSDVAVEVGFESLLVSWSPPAPPSPSTAAVPVTGYRVFWRAGRAGPVSVLVDVADLLDPSAPSYRIPDLVNGRPHAVSVAAVNAVGQGPAVSAEPPSGTNGWVPAVTASSVPQSLLVVPDFDDGSVDVSWAAPADTGGSVLVSFMVEYRCGDVSAWSAAAGSPVLFVSAAQSQSLSVAGLPIGEVCEFRVAAVSSGSGADAATSGYATAETVAAVAPDAPTGLVVSPANGALHVSWTPPGSAGGSPVTGFRVFYASGGDPAVVLVPASETSTVISGLLNRFAYVVSVSAVSAAGESSRAVAAPVQPAAVPSAPLHVTAVPPPVVGGEPHDGSALVVSWRASAVNGTSPVTGFTLQFRTAAVPESADGAGDARRAGPWSAAVTVDAYALSHMFEGLMQGVAYDVRVAAVNDSDVDVPGVQPQTGLFGYAFSAVPATLPGVVSAVTVESGFRSLIVSWAPPASTGGADITHYMVRYALNRDGWEPFSAPVRVDAADGAPLRTVLSGLEPDAPYVVHVAAVNRLGSGSLESDDFPGSTLGVPSAPAAVSAVSVKASVGGLLAVSWSGVVDSNGAGPIVGYRVESRTGVSGVWVQADSDPDMGGLQDFAADARSAEVAAPVGAVVTVRVRAVTSVGWLGSSGYAPSVTVLAVPEAPLSVTAVVVDGLQGVVDVSWTHAAHSVSSSRVGNPVSGYRVQWFPADASVHESRGQVVVPGRAVDSFRIVGLLPQAVDDAARVYRVRVAAVNSVGDSVFTAVSVTVVPPVSS